MRTRFTLFSWGVRCALCCRQVCAKCSGRMRIPLEHFSAVPVYALSPASTSPLATPTTGECSSSGGEIAESRRRFSRDKGAQAPRNRLSCIVSPVTGAVSVGSGAGRSRSGAGSAPTSPTAGRRRSDAAAAEEGPSSGVGGGPTSLPVFTSQGPTTISAR
jgi:hypothetical protein